jgi:hypothetical protein
VRASLTAAMLFVASVASAATFRFERTVLPAARGANRLDVDAALIAGAADGFRDLRLFDASGREVPYLIEAPRNAEEQWIGGAKLAVAPTKTTTAFETDLGSARQLDRFRIDGVAAPFLKHVRLEGSGDRAHWNLLADATVFDLPDQKLRQHEIAFAPGEYRYLRLTWDDRNSAVVHGDVHGEARLRLAGSPAEQVRAALPFRAMSADPRVSRYRVTLPAAGLPITAIQVQVAPGDVFRQATVTQPVLQANEIVQVPIGSSTLGRASRDGAIAEDLTIPVTRPAANELTLSIDTDAKPPLPVTGINAVYAPQPWIYFESSDGAPLTARYGNPTAAAPQYDLEAARRFIGGASIATARWASASASSAAAAKESTPALPSRGAKVDRASFRYARPLPSSPAGMAVVPLDAHVLAFSRNQEDVRIVDAEGRQIPYVLERRQEPLAIELKVPARVQAGHVSKYRLALPYASLPDEATLVLTTTARVFERQVSIIAGETRRGEPRELANESWRNSDPETPAAKFTVTVPVHGSNELDVAIDEGDNAPLPITAAQLLLPGYAVRFDHPGTPLWLVYGNREAQTPRYDLALLAPQLFTMPAHELFLGAVAGAPANEDGVQRKYFWIAIAAAVLALIVLLSRLLLAAPAAAVPSDKAAPRSEP